MEELVRLISELQHQYNLSFEEIYYTLLFSKVGLLEYKLTKDPNDRETKSLSFEEYAFEIRNISSGVDMDYLSCARLMVLHRLDRLNRQLYKHDVFMDDTLTQFNERISAIENKE